jgi:hypothetical protein
MSKESEYNEGTIDRLTSNMFHQVTCPRSDALTVFIPKDQKPSSEIQKVLEEAGPQRWFPQEGGHLVKIPNVFDSYDNTVFKLEKDSWDHEHCDKCGASINFGETCWTAETDNNTYLFCDNCYHNLNQK